MATTQNWQRTSDGYRRGPVEIHDNGAGGGSHVANYGLTCF